MLMIRGRYRIRPGARLLIGGKWEPVVEVVWSERGRDRTANGSLEGLYDSEREAVSAAREQAMADPRFEE